MSWMNSGLLYVSTKGIFFPAHLGCDLVPFNTQPPDPLLAIATDLLAQAEAQHRTATRVEQSVRQLSRVARDRSARRPVEQVRKQVRAMRDLSEAARVLLDELERELSGASR
jgi:hypothetical protein